jgi:hypothetical protein
MIDGCIGSDLEARTTIENNTLLSELALGKHTRIEKVLPIIKRNGFVLGFHGIAPQDHSLYNTRKFNLNTY